VNATLTTRNIARLLYYPCIDVDPMNVSEPLPQHFCSLVYQNVSPYFKNFACGSCCD